MYKSKLFLVIFLGILSVLLFYSIRDYSEYSNIDHNNSIIDAAFYNYLVNDKINNLGEAVYFSPNIETTGYIVVSYIFSEIFGHNVYIRSLANLLFLLYSLWYLQKIDAKLLSINLILIISPLILYCALNTKESLMTPLLLIYFSANVQNNKKIMRISEFLLLCIRPILGLTLIIFNILKNKKFYSIAIILILIMTGAIDDFIKHFNESEKLILENTGSICSYAFINFCVDGDNYFSDGLKYIIRAVIWMVIMPIKQIYGAIDLAIVNTPFEKYLIILNIFSGIGIIYTIINIMRYKNLPINNSLYLLLIFAFEIGGILFMQTMRLVPIYGIALYFYEYSLSCNKNDKS